VLFHTWTFLLFFAVVFCAYLPLRKTRFYIYWLLLASYVFYSCWNPLYLLLIVYSTLIDYVAVLLMERSRRRKLWLVASIVNNLLLLGFFKYGAFVAENLTALLRHAGLAITIPPPGVLLPVGISFYVFQSMSYTIDFYRREIPSERNFFRFATYVSLFPQLVAGPIERARNLLPQLHTTPDVSVTRLSEGLSLFLAGLFKKLAVADFLARYVRRVYETAEVTPDAADSGSLLLATFAFSWVIYCDFSGYTDMARGVAKMLGFDLMLNFRRPYLATSLGDFWRRWHISLSTWFRDYVYIPLGGNRKGPLATYANMSIVMLVSALWHGAGWHFIAWGALHAAGRLATRALESTAFYRDRVPGFVKRGVVFSFVTFAWVFFASNSFTHSLTICRRIFAFEFSDPQFPLLGLALILGLWAYQYVSESRLNTILQNSTVKVLTMAAIVAYLVVLEGAPGQPFIYFQF